MKEVALKTRKSISVVIPAWNEAAGIQKTIMAIPRSELEKAGYTVQVLVIDGGSSDGTQDIAKAEGAEVIVEPRRGYGRAYKTGFARATGDIIITADGDATYPLKEIPMFLTALEVEDLEFVTTNRFAKMEKGSMSFRNKLGNKILSGQVKLLFGLNLKDPESGMWIFKRKILGNLKMESDNNVFSHEIKLEACYFAKCRWREVPVSYKARSGGDVKLTNGIKGWVAGLNNITHILFMRLVRSAR
jgi:dolichol-phosphate hexosyltransferase